MLAHQLFLGLSLENIRNNAIHQGDEMICLTLSGSTLMENAETIRSNRAYIDAAELRVDYLNEDEQKKASLFPAMVDIPVILTLRRTIDGGRCGLSERRSCRALESGRKGGLRGSQSVLPLKKGQTRGCGTAPSGQK